MFFGFFSQEVAAKQHSKPIYFVFRLDPGWNKFPMSNWTIHLPPIDYHTTLQGIVACPHQSVFRVIFIKIVILNPSRSNYLTVSNKRKTKPCAPKRLPILQSHHYLSLPFWTIESQSNCLILPRTSHSLESFSTWVMNELVAAVPKNQSSFTHRVDIGLLNTFAAWGLPVVVVAGAVASNG